MSAVKRKFPPKPAAKKRTVKVVTMPPTWSFSRWATYNKCPLQAKLAYIDGYRGEASAATSRGSEIHRLAEDWIMAKKKMELPPIFHHFRHVFEELRKHKAVAEVAVGFTRDWKPCEFDAKDYWWHGEIDAVAMVGKDKCLVDDWKTGKKYDDHKLQLELYAIAMFLQVPELNEITCRDHYIDLKQTETMKFLRRQLPAMIEIWERRVAPMFNDRTFPPCPSFLCPWCIASKENGLCPLALSEEEKEAKLAKSAARRR